MDGLRARPQRRLVEPQVLRLQGGERRVAARDARPDRWHRHVAEIHREKRSGREDCRRAAGRQGDRCAHGARLARRVAARAPSRCARAGRRPPRRPWRSALRRTDRRHPSDSRGPAHAHPAGAAPSAVQPGGDRSGLRALAGRRRRWPASTPASTAVSPRSRRSFRCRARSARPVCSGTGSTGCRTNTSPRSCRKWRRRSPTDA